MRTSRLLIFIMILLPVVSFGQDSAENLINALADKTREIKSFEVEALIKIDVDFIDIKDRNIKIIYESPDKFSFEGKGLILLPKNGVQMEYMSILNDNYTAIEAGSESMSEIHAEIVKVIPESIDSDIILAQLWIDPEVVRIMKMKTFTKSSGSYVINFEYSGTEMRLPSRLEVIFEISNMSIPVKMMNDFVMDPTLAIDSIPNQAKVIIEYSDYNITYK
jgi:hypothetical protein